MIRSSDLTPQQRLANSRRALVSYMTHDERSEQEQLAHPLAEGQRHAPTGTWGIIKRAVRVWWQHHPAQMAVNLAKPVLGKYAKEKPFQLLGLAIGLGAVAALVRPWRLVSITGLALGALKSSEVSGLLLSLLSASPKTPESPETPADPRQPPH